MMKLIFKSLVSGLLIALFTHLSYWFSVGYLDQGFTVMDLMITTEITLFLLVFLTTIVIGLNK